MLQDTMKWMCPSWCLLLLVLSFPSGLGVQLDTEQDWDWGSGFPETLNTLPADSPVFMESAGTPVNCTQRFWLPPSTPSCWDDTAGPEEFEKTRALVLQNRAALLAASQSSGLEEARQDVRGVQSDHHAVTQTADAMLKVFVDLDKKRKGHLDLTLMGLKEQLEKAKSSISKRKQAADLLEKQRGNLERSLNIMQLRLTKLLFQ